MKAKEQILKIKYQQLKYKKSKKMDKMNEIQPGNKFIICITCCVFKTDGEAQEAIFLRR